MTELLRSVFRGSIHRLIWFHRNVRRRRQFAAVDHPAVSGQLRSMRSRQLRQTAHEPHRTAAESQQAAGTHVDSMVARELCRRASCKSSRSCPLRVEVQTSIATICWQIAVTGSTGEQHLFKRSNAVRTWYSHGHANDNDSRSDVTGHESPPSLRRLLRMFDCERR